jgi:hypothetical protein
VWVGSSSFLLPAHITQPKGDDMEINLFTNNMAISLELVKIVKGMCPECQVKLAERLEQLATSIHDAIKNAGESYIFRR